MKSVLRSVKPYWIYKIIYTKEKTIEVGKNYPKDDNWDRTVYLYCSKDMKSFNRIPKEHQEAMRKYLGKVVCKFVFDEIITFEPRIYKDDGSLPWDSDCIIYACDKRTCLTGKQFEEYGKGKTLYGWHISQLKIYDNPKELSEILKKCNDNGNCMYCKNAGFNGGACNGRMTRPPQSWCYVEEL